MFGVPREADAKVIKDPFHALAMKFHPDRNKALEAEERFTEIAEAYGVLSDPKKRADYDAGGFAGLKGMRPEDLSAGIDFDNLFGGLGFDFGGGIFDRIFGGRRRTAGPQRGDKLEALLQVSLECVVSGGDEPLRVARSMACTACEGSGRQVKIGREGGLTLQQVTICSTSGGRGSFIDDPCQECQGHGKVERTESLTVEVPVGVEEGIVLRLRGKGLPRFGGGQHGDLLLRLRVLVPGQIGPAERQLYEQLRDLQR